MKNLLKIISILAILNILAILGLAGWLFSAGRVDRDRVLELTAILGETPEARAARLQAERLAALPPEPEDQSIDGDIQSTDRRNQARVELTMVDRERIERLQREVQDLQAQLRQQRQMLERERQTFEQDKTAFQDMRTRLTEIEGAEAFQSALEVLVGMKPADIRPVLTQLLAEDKTDEVIAYLAAFDDRLRPKVITEFVKAGETEVAADLLESLRTRGLEPAVAGATGP